MGNGNGRENSNGRSDISATQVISATRSNQNGNPPIIMKGTIFSNKQEIRAYIPTPPDPSTAQHVPNTRQTTPSPPVPEHSILGSPRKDESHFEDPPGDELGVYAVEGAVSEIEGRVLTLHKLPSFIVYSSSAALNCTPYMDTSAHDPGSLRKTRFRPRNCISAAVIVLLSLLHGLPAASACPSLCTCSTPPLISRIGAVYDGVIEPRKGVRMECTEAGLSSVPLVEALGDLDPAAVTSMDLSNNNLTSVPDNAFAAYPSLQYLRLSGNRISSVSPQAFEGVKLQNLYLDNNQLVGLVAGSLPDTLAELSLEDNFFITIPPAVSLIRDLQLLPILYDVAM
nr:uncharacterized protein LOC113828667 [Penaeus vannamei]